MGALIAVLNNKDEDAAKTAATMLKTLRTEERETFAVASPTSAITEETVEKLAEKITAPTVVGRVLSKDLASGKPSFIMLESATLAFEGRTYPPIKKQPSLKTGLQEYAAALIENVEGAFTFAIAQPTGIIAGRDPLGLYPLYYGENAELAAIASERKALWKIGVGKAESFPPGHTATIDKNGFTFTPVRTLKPSELKTMTMKTASRRIQTLLQRSVKERVSDLKEVAVAFSGGLDSTMIAFLAKKTKTDVHLIHASLRNQHETRHAQQIAEELKLPIDVTLHDESDVEQVLPEVLWIIEEPDPVKASIAIPLYWASETAAERKLQAILAGQGADELFGGYKKYVDNYIQSGSGKAREAIISDIMKMHETNFERDFKITNFHGVELRLPFATCELTELALAMPLELKIEPSEETLRKLALRQVASNLGLPKSAVKKPKKAVQYSTGVAKALRNLSKKESLSVEKYMQKIFKETFNRRMRGD